MNDEIKKLLIKYYTARIDIKNSGNSNNEVQVIKNDDPDALIFQPDWFHNWDGIGTQIESNKCSLDMKLKCINPGTLRFWLKGIYCKDKVNNRFPVYIDYTVFEINGENLLHENKVASLDAPIYFSRNVSDGEILKIRIKWLPVNNNSKYEKLYNLPCNDLNILSSLVNRDYRICEDNYIITQYYNIFKLLTPLNSEKIKKLRIGGKNDGGYVMADPGFNGLAFSFGVSYHSPWDLEMAERGFKVYQFDGTIDAPTEQHENLVFSKLNITGNKIADDGNINFKGILDKFSLNDSKDIILQIDIEGYEWEFFDSISDDDLKRFSQIIVEFHGMLDYSKLEFYTKIFEKLNKYHQPIHFHYNNNGEILLINNFLISSLFEVSFIRKDDIKFQPSLEIYPTELDMPCVTKFNELHIGQFDDILKNINPSN